MSFVYPNILYFLLLLIIPIIIHLFNFRRYKKLYFSSLQFIRKVEKETNSTKKLRHYLILISRMLAFTALIFAFAQPFIPTDKHSKEFQQVVPIYLDNSFSMSAKGTNGSLLNQSKTSIRKIIDNYPKGTQYMLVTNQLSGIEHRIITKAELEDRLNEVSLSPITRTLTNPLHSIQEHLNSINFKGSKDYYILSDFQTINVKQEEQSIDTSANYSLLALRPQQQQNLYIDSVWFEEPFQRVNVNNTLHIRVQNNGDNKITNAEINLEVNNKKRQTLADLEANSSTDVELNYTDKDAGIKEGVVEVMDEQLYFDNRFFFSYEVATNIDVAVLNGGNSATYPQLVYSTDSYYKVQEIQVERVKINELGNSDLIVLNGLDKISSGLLTKLKQLEQQGKHLLLIPSQDYDEASYNVFLNAFQLPLLNGTSSSEIRIGKIQYANSFFNGMFDKKVENIRMPPVQKYIQSRIYNRANFNPLINFENKMPLLAESAKNNRVFAFYSAINKEFNNLGATGLFSSVLLRIGEQSQGQQPLSLEIGSSDTYTYQTAQTTESAVRLKNKDYEFIPEIMNENNSSSIAVRKASQNQQIKAGVYSIFTDQKELGKIALNFNRQESKLEYQSQKEVKQLLQKLGATQIGTFEISNLNDINQITVNKPNEYWRILLILSIFFFLMEMSIIIFWKI